MNRLVCVVEGAGEVEALPNLCARVLAALGATSWFVDKAPIRQPRSQLVDESVPSPNRPCLPKGVARAMAIAEGRGANAALVLVDSDDDCPASWAKSFISGYQGQLPAAAVMAVREFESWLLWAQPSEARERAGAANPEAMRDAKKPLRKIIPGYKPTTHQLALTQKIDIAAVRAQSSSFDKFVRSIASLVAGPMSSASP